MSRHRNVRSMNYNDEYDGYDDIYGHSVEDDYCISPSDEAQFMYDRTRQPQISAFFSDQDNITEEDENLDVSIDRKNSDCYVHPTLSDVEEAKLRSCLEEIRNVIGEDIPEKILVETVLNCKFDINKSLDTILSNTTTSTETCDVPKVQRVRKDRDKDVIHSQNNIHNRTCSSNVNELSGSLIDCKDSEKITCEKAVHCKKCDQSGKENNISNLNLEQSSIVHCDSLSSQDTVNSPCSSFFSESSHSKYCGSILTHTFLKPDTLQEDGKGCDVIDKMSENLKNPKVKKFSRILDGSSKNNFQEHCLISKMGSSDGLNLKLGPNPGKLSVAECPDTAEAFLDSSDEECSPSPLAALAKLHINTRSQSQPSQDEGVSLMSSFVGERGALNFSMKNISETDDRRQALQNMIIGESRTNPCNDSGMNNAIKSVETHLQGDKSESVDDLHDKRKLFSPLAVLANRLHGNPKSEEISKKQSLSSCRVDGFRKVGEIAQLGISTEEWGENLKKLCLDANNVSVALREKSSDDEDDAISPLATLAGKYHKVKSDSLELKRDFNITSAEEGYSCMPGETSEEHSTKTIFEYRSVSGALSSAFLPCGYSYGKSSSGLGCSVSGLDHYKSKEHEDVLRHSTTLFNCENSNDSKIGNGELNLMSNKSASSLSDLAFFHLSRSASGSEKSECDFHNKKFHSDSGLSKSVPRSFVIPFLKERDIQNAEQRMEGVGMDTTEDAVEETSGDEWIIDLSNAICDPGLRPSFDITEDTKSTKIIDVLSAEVPEEKSVISCVPCQLDAQGILKMKVLCSRRKCSAFGRVLCHQWRELSRPYIPPTRQPTGALVQFTFSSKSPDDSILFHLNSNK